MLRSLPLCPSCRTTDAKLVSQDNHRSALNGTPIGLPPSTIFRYLCTCGCSFAIAVPILTKRREGTLLLDMTSRFGGRGMIKPMTWTADSWATVWAVRIDSDAERPQCRSQFRRSLEGNRVALCGIMPVELLDLIEKTAASDKSEDFRELAPHPRTFAHRNDP